MAGIVATIASWVGWIGGIIECYWGLLTCALFNLVYDLLNAIVTAAVSLIALIPIPSEVASWSWPDAGPIVGVLGEVGFAQATAIVAGAMSIKFLLRLIPFVRL